DAASLLDCRLFSRKRGLRSANRRIEFGDLLASDGRCSGPIGCGQPIRPPNLGNSLFAADKFFAHLRETVHKPRCGMMRRFVLGLELIIYVGLADSLRQM